MLGKVQTVIIFLHYVNISMICTTTDEWATVVAVVTCEKTDPELQATDKVTVNPAHTPNQTYRPVFASMHKTIVIVKNCQLQQS